MYLPTKVYSICLLRLHIKKKKKKSAKDLFDDVYPLFSNFLYKSICCGYSFELHGQVEAIQMGIHNKCLSKEVDKKYTGCNLKTTEVLDCAL